MQNATKLSDDEKRQLLLALKMRFEKNRSRHKEIDWNQVEDKLEKSPGKLRSLSEMESSGGEPDVIGYDRNNDSFIFCDCSPESPKGRRSICYDKAAWEARKEHKPANNAVDVAEAMGIEILSEAQYRRLQELGEFDLKTSSWIKTPDEIRKRGGALFCDRRYDHVFVYHNGADSYYAARGFRGLLYV